MEIHSLWTASDRQKVKTCNTEKNTTNCTHTSNNKTIFIHIELMTFSVDLRPSSPIECEME